MNGALLAEGACDGVSGFDAGGQLKCNFSEATTGILESVFNWFVSGTVWAVKWIGSAWLHFPEPTIGTSGGTPSDNLSVLWNYSGFYVLGIAVIGFLFAVLRLMASPGVQSGKAIFRGVLSIAAVQSLSIGATVLLLDAGNQFSTWIVLKASGKDFETAMSDFSGLGGVSKAVLTAGALNSVGTMLVVSLVGFLLLLLGAIAQVGLLIVRSALLVILLAFLPALAASAFTEGGSKALSKAIGWLLALILYKPVAGVIYAVGVLTLNNASNDATPEEQMMNLLIGVVIVGAAAAALPALIKFVAPQAAAGASMAFSGGAMAAGAVGVGAAVVGIGATVGTAGAAAPAAAATTGASTAATSAATTGAGTAGSGTAAAGNAASGSSEAAAGGTTGSGPAGADTMGDAAEGGATEAGAGEGGRGSGATGSGSAPSSAAPSEGGSGSSKASGGESAEPPSSPSGGSSSSGVSGANSVDGAADQSSAPVGGGRHRKVQDVAGAVRDAANKANQGAKDTDFNEEGGQ